jgi:hypothetical protein
MVTMQRRNYRLIPLKKSLFDYFTLVFGGENGASLAVFRGSSAESSFKT